MTLSELTDFVCTTIQQTEAVDRAACKMYFKLRHQMLWQLALWKDSLVSYTQTIASTGYDPATSTWLPTRQILEVAPIITHVIALRTDDRKMSVQSQEYYYCRDIDAFNNSGSTVEYVLLPPAVLDFDTAQDISVLCAETSDEGSILQTTSLSSDGITESELSTSLSPRRSLLGSVLTILSASKLAGTGDVILGTPPEVFLVASAMTDGSTISFGVNTTDPGEAQLSLTVGQSGILSVTVGDNLFVFFNGIFIGPAYPVTSTVGTLSVGDPDMSGNRFTFTAGTGTNIATMAATDTNMAKRQRLQLIGAYPDGLVLRVLGKRTCPRLTDDNDEPAIVGSEPCLIAAAMSDMLKRERQYGKAIAMATQEFGPTLDILKKEQTAQQAFRKRLVPVGGFGDANAFIGPAGYTIW